jgi:hypothetical protein
MEVMTSPKYSYCHENRTTTGRQAEVAVGTVIALFTPLLYTSFYKTSLAPT